MSPLFPAYLYNTPSACTHTVLQYGWLCLAPCIKLLGDVTLETLGQGKLRMGITRRI